MYLKILSLVSVCLFTVDATAQKVEHSVSQVISSKASKGSLIDVKSTEESIDLTYLIKQKKKELELETYSFSKDDLKYLGSEDVVASPSDYQLGSGTTEKGDRILRMYCNAMGKAVIKLGYIQYTVYPRYTLEKFIETDELKPRGLDGENTYYVHHRMDESNQNKEEVLGKERNLNIGDIQLITVNAKEPFYTDYSSMIIKAENLTTESKTGFTLPYSYVLLNADNLPNGDMALVFRPYTIKDMPNPDNNMSRNIMSHYKFAEKYHLRYVQIGRDGSLKKNIEIDFNEPESGYYFAMDIIPSSNEDGVMIMGTTRPLKILGPPLKRMGLIAKTIWEEEKSIYYHKADRFFKIKIEGDQVAYSLNEPIENSFKDVVNADGEKAPKDVKAFYGKFGVEAPRPHYYVHTEDGDVVLFRKSFTTKLWVLQLSNKGEVESSKVIKYAGGGVFIQPEVFESKDGLLMITFSQPGVKDDASKEEKTEAMFQRKCVAYRIDTKANTVSDGVDFTPDGFIDPYNSFIVADQDKVVALGNGRKKEIILTQISLQ